MIKSHSLSEKRLSISDLYIMVDSHKPHCLGESNQEEHGEGRRGFESLWKVLGICPFLMFRTIPGHVLGFPWMRPGSRRSNRKCQHWRVFLRCFHTCSTWTSCLQWTRPKKSNLLPDGLISNSGSYIEFGIPTSWWLPGRSRTLAI